MLDLAGILFSSIMMFIVIFRAVQLDQRRPWFERPQRRNTSDEQPQRPAGGQQGWRRGR